MQLQVENTKSISGRLHFGFGLCGDDLHFEEVVDLVKKYIHTHPDVEHDPTRWIEGMGWDQTKWPGAAFPIAVRSMLALPPSN